MKSLGEYIKDSMYLQDLIIQENQITDRGIEILSGYLIGNTKLKSLDFYGNREITDKSIPILIEVIKSSQIGSFSIKMTSVNQKNAFVAPLAYNVMKYGSSSFNLVEK